MTKAIETPTAEPSVDADALRRLAAAGYVAQSRLGEGIIVLVWSNYAYATDRVAESPTHVARPGEVWKTLCGQWTDTGYWNADPFTAEDAVATLRQSGCRSCERSLARMARAT